MLPRRLAPFLVALLLALPVAANAPGSAYFDFQDGVQGWTASGTASIQVEPDDRWEAHDLVLEAWSGEDRMSTVEAPALPTGIHQLVLPVSMGDSEGQDIAEVRNAGGETMLRLVSKFGTADGSWGYSIFATDPEGTHTDQWSGDPVRPVHDHRWGFERYEITFHDDAYTLHVGQDTATAKYLTQGPPATLHLRPGSYWLKADNVRYHVSDPLVDASFEEGLAPLTIEVADDGSPLFPTFVRAEPDARGYRSYGEAEILGSFFEDEHAYLRTDALLLDQNWLAEIAFRTPGPDAGDGIALLAGLDDQKEVLWAVGIVSDLFQPLGAPVDVPSPVRPLDQSVLTFYDDEGEATHMGPLIVGTSTNWSKVRVSADVTTDTLTVYKEDDQLAAFQGIDVTGTTYIATGDVFDALGPTRFARLPDQPSGDGYLAVDDLLVTVG